MQVPVCVREIWIQLPIWLGTEGGGRERHRCSRECKRQLMCSMEQKCYMKHFKVGQVTKCLGFIGEKHLVRV